MVAGCFEGFNATVIAYGQTGAGKTHTMGTGFEMDVKPEDEGKFFDKKNYKKFIKFAKKGMIPRALRQIFDGIAEKCDACPEGTMKPEFMVSVQFMEIYNEEIVDLLGTFFV